MPTVFITGAARRVGRAIALDLAAQGYDIAAHVRAEDADSASLQRDVESLGRRVLILPADLEHDEAAPLVSRAAKQLGAVDLLVHNASIFERDELATLTHARFARHMRVHAYSALALIQGLTAQPGAQGNIILMGDGTHGWSMGAPFLSYTVSKLALMGLPALLAQELAPHWRINAIGLGPTLPGAQDEPGTFARLAERIPLKHTSSVAEVVTTINYLREAVSVTGQTIHLSGGLQANAYARITPNAPSEG